jgi:hypothetical protein
MSTSASAQQETQLLSRELFIVDDDDADAGHQAVARSDMTSSGISIRADVPSPGTLSSLS